MFDAPVLAVDSRLVSEWGVSSVYGVRCKRTGGAKKVPRRYCFYYVDATRDHAIPASFNRPSYRVQAVSHLFRDWRHALLMHDAQPTNDLGAGHLRQPLTYIQISREVPRNTKKMDILSCDDHTPEPLGKLMIAFR